MFIQLHELVYAAGNGQQYRCEMHVITYSANGQQKPSQLVSVQMLGIRNIMKSNTGTWGD